MGSFLFVVVAFGAALVLHQWVRPVTQHETLEDGWIVGPRGRQVLRTARTLAAVAFLLGGCFLFLISGVADGNDPDRYNTLALNAASFVAFTFATMVPAGPPYLNDWLWALLVVLASAAFLVGSVLIWIDNNSYCCVVPDQAFPYPLSWWLSVATAVASALMSGFTISRLPR